MRPMLRTVLLAAACALLIAGCAGYTSYRQGSAKVADGDLVGGLEKLREATQLAPDNTEFRRTYYTQRENAIATLLREADVALEAGRFDDAVDRYERVQKIDPGSDRARFGLDRVALSRRHAVALSDASKLATDGKYDDALLKVRGVLSENPNERRAQTMLRQIARLQADASGKELGLYPKLRQAFRKPVTLSFNNASLTQVFESIKLAAGLNFMFDRDVRTETRTTMQVTNKPVEDVIRLVLAMNQLERRVLDEDTLLIYPNNQQKAAEYRELVVRSFYLSNAEASRAANLVRTIAKAKEVFVDEKLNLVIVRDSADVVRLAEKLIANLDLAEPEVMLELEVLEVSSSRLTELGVNWPTSASASVAGAAGQAGQMTLREFHQRSADMVTLQFNDPLMAAQLRAEKGSASLLANPRIRVRNRQSAKVLIGQRVPVITTTTTANVGTSESVSYLDVGLKLEIEPNISVDDDVSMRVALEVSNILETIKRSTGTQTYRLGTRNASTMLRLRDNETQILAGLIQKDERSSNTGLPGVNDMPLLNRLFGSGTDESSNTEIVLLITPHIVRNIDVPGPGQIEILSGTESTLGGAPIQLGIPSGTASGAQQPSARPQMPTPAPSVITPYAPPVQVPSNTAPAPLSPPPIVPSSPTSTMPPGANGVPSADPANRP